MAREEPSVVCRLLGAAAAGMDRVWVVLEEEEDEGGRLEAGGFFIT